MRDRVACLLALWLAGCATPKTWMAVAVPVVDLRTRPRTSATPGIHDPLEETQLLYGERVRRIRSQDGWASIEAVEQPEFTHTKRWQGYPGWVPEAALKPWRPLEEPNLVVTQTWASVWLDAYRLTPARWRLPLGARVRATNMGETLWRLELLDDTTAWMAYRDAQELQQLRALPVADQRRLVVRNAELLLRDPYYWGGRSPHAPQPEGPVTGVDCSGLVNLAYRAAGIDIPRDAHEQFLRARRVTAVRPADLIFLSEPKNPARIVHVMLYAGEGVLIEGPGTGTVVRRISVENRLGRRIDHLTSGVVIEEQTVSFGAYLP